MTTWNKDKEMEYLTVAMKTAKLFKEMGRDDLAKEVEKTASRFVLMMREAQSTLEMIDEEYKFIEQEIL